MSATTEERAPVSRRGATDTEDDRTALLFDDMRNPWLPAPDRRAARDEIISAYSGLATAVARRFINRGEPFDDLKQVALVGLIKAVDGFDPDRGVHFASYAAPSILGEIKHHFRDQTGSIRVSRRLQELSIDIANASVALTQELQGTPTVADLAAYLEVSEAEIRECALSSQARRAGSLSARSLDEPSAGADEELLGMVDHQLESVADRHALRGLVLGLAPRERRILGLRFWEDMSQTQIATRLGISQMHVSRLLRRSLDRLQTGLSDQCSA